MAALRFYEKFGGVALLAGVGCYFMAGSLIVLAPALLTNAGEPVVTVDGKKIAVKEFTEIEAAGREHYIDQVCWHCHSQFVRPVNEEWRRWGPVSQPGESMVDQPHLFSTRRIGPDLAREGGRRVDDWQYAHLYDPRYTVSDSVMPAFTWFFRDHADQDEIRTLIANLDSDGDGIISWTEGWDDTTYWSEQDSTKVKAPSLDNRGVLWPAYTQSKPGSQWENGSDLWPDANGVSRYSEHDRFTGEEGGDGRVSDRDAAPVPTERATQLIAYLQRLGTAIPKWRKPVVMGTPTRGYRPPMMGVETEYETVDGRKETVEIADGLMPRREREARRYGYAWSKATKAEQDDAVNRQRRYEALMKAWREANPEWDLRLEKGEKLYKQNCASCHGDEGRGNGDGAPFMVVRPRDFTRGLYRYRSTQVGNLPLDGDLFRGIYRGLWGSSMPPWRELPEEEIWILVDYVKHFYEGSNDEYGKFFDDQSKKLAIPAIPPAPSDPEEYEALVQRGKAVYMAMNCNNCHGSTGRGDGPGWNTTTKSNGGIVRPRDFAVRTIFYGENDQPELRFRGGATPQDIFRTIYTGLDGTGMPSQYSDFFGSTGVFAQAAELARLKAEGAPQSKIAAAARAARRKLHLPLKDPKLFEVGVEAGTDENGNYAEYVTLFRPTEITAAEVQFGDDWALVLYMMDLAGLQWPLIAEEE